MAKITKKNFNLFTVLLFIITGAFIGFIWIHSSMSAEVSAAESKGVLDFLLNILKFFGFSPELTDHIVRKSAHFCEFALLGVLTFWCGFRLRRKILVNLMPVGFVCLAVGVIDEFVQTFSPGRSCEVNDVILDFFGSVFGVMLIIAFLTVKSLITGKRR